MLLRVRWTDKDDIIVCQECRFSEYRFPITTDELDAYILRKINAHKNMAFRLSVVTGKVIPTPYYELFRSILKSNNMSKLHFVKHLVDILHSHGFSVTINYIKKEEKTEEEKQRLIQVDLYLETIKKEDCEKISLADEIDVREYMDLCKKHGKTEEEVHKVQRYLITTTYKVSEITPELVHKLGSSVKIRKHKNMRYFNGDLRESREYIECGIKNTMSRDNFDMITHRGTMSKTWRVLDILIMMGYNNMGDSVTLTSEKKQVILDYFRDDIDNITGTFGTEKIATTDSSIPSIVRYIKEKALLEGVKLKATRSRNGGEKITTCTLSIEIEDELREFNIQPHPLIDYDWEELKANTLLYQRLIPIVV